jgi:hypothetical protein
LAAWTARSLTTFSIRDCGPLQPRVSEIAQTTVGDSANAIKKGFVWIPERRVSADHLVSSAAKMVRQPGLDTRDRIPDAPMA